MNQHERRGQAPGRWIWGGVVGPALFVASWAVLGGTRHGYSPVDDAISRLAETGSSTRPVMTAGFVAYGAGLAGYAAGLRASQERAWVPAASCALATFGVAAFPLGTPVSASVHAGFAVAGYAALALVPVVAAPTLGDTGHTTAATASVVTGVVTAGLLAASAAGAPAHGLTQRAGLTLGDAWVVVSAVVLARRRWRSGPGPGTARRTRR